METFGGNFKQRQSFLLYTHNFFGVFSKSYTDFVILNYKELANFEITSGYPLPITVESPNKGHFGTNINSSGLSTVRLSSVKRLLLIGGLKFGDFVLSIVERYLIQCPLFGVSINLREILLY